MIETLERKASPVIDLIEGRIKDGSKPGNRRDGRRIGLVFEGGGTRAVRIAWMAAALDVVGARDSFDAMYGVSSGSAVMMGFAAGQAEAARIFSQEINTPEFFDGKRFIPWYLSEVTGLRRGKMTPVVNIKYLIDHVFVNRVPLKTDLIVNSEIPLNAFVVDALKPETIRHQFYNTVDPMSVLGDGCSVTFWGGMPRVDGNQHLTDGGGLISALPLKIAMQECDALLVLLMRPGGKWNGALDPTEQVIPWLLRQRYPEFSKRLRDGNLVYSEALSTIAQAKKNGGRIEGVDIDYISVSPGALELPSMEINGVIQRREGRGAFAAGLSKFAGRGLRENNDLLNILAAI